MDKFLWIGDNFFLSNLAANNVNYYTLVPLMNLLCSWPLNA